MNSTAFTSGAPVSLAQTDPNLLVVGTNDFTGDGQPDLLVQHQQTGAVTLYKMNGLSQVGQQGIPIAVNTPWHVVAAADLNGDSHADIVWENFTTGEVYVWLMAPAGGWAGYAGSGGAFLGDYIHLPNQARISLGPTTMRVAGAADLNMDGQTDLVWQDDTTGALGVWYLNGLTRTSAVALNPGAVNPVWRIRAVGDYSGDGHPDLIWQHVSSGELVAWLLSGPNLVASGYLSPGAVNPMWRLLGPR
jgi:hypothetical protein